jgi:hypothetical protein
MSYTLNIIGSIPHVEYFTPGVDDILVVSPDAAYKDDPQRSQATVEFQQNYSRALGKKCGLVVVMNNLLSQDAESRKIYSEGTLPSLFYGVAIVVGNPMARAIGVFTLRLTKVAVPTRLVETIDEGIAWLETLKLGDA